MLFVRVVIFISFIFNIVVVIISCSFKKPKDYNNNYRNVTTNTFFFGFISRKLNSFQIPFVKLNFKKVGLVVIGISLIGNTRVQ